MNRVLITGGAGFIGAHLADELITRGYRVRVLDNLSEQVHGPLHTRPPHLSDDVELLVGDVRDPTTVSRALTDVDGVFHLAAAVGVGQSMYRLAHYTDVNNLGTAVLLEAMLQCHVERLVVASSMSIYGEGLYRTLDGSIVANAQRTRSQLERGEWDPRGPNGESLIPVPTLETKTPSVTSVYALSKYGQENMCLMVSEAYGIHAVALRLFNVYGTHQALSNPYTGVLAIFASRLLNGNSPMIYEDGMQQRDFVNVADVARAFRLAYEIRDNKTMVCNIGSGKVITINEIAEIVSRALNRHFKPEPTRKYRFGDVRHCVADLSRAKELLGYEAQIGLEEGLDQYTKWLERQICDDKVAHAAAELTSRGLLI